MSGQGRWEVGEALKGSWALTEGRRMDVFVWLLVCLGLGLAGALACCVGLLATAPLAALGSAIVYDRLREAQAA